MKTIFSKQKLVEAQEKKVRGGLVNGLLSRKHLKAGDASKDDPVVIPPSAHSLAKRPASPTSSLEVIASAEEETKKKKAHEVLSMDYINPLMVKLSSEVMSSYIQKL